MRGGGDAASAPGRYIPLSRDRLPRDHIITRTCEALRAAGFEVDTQIDRTHRPTAEVEADCQAHWLQARQRFVSSEP
jgi:hypothetical protein